MHALRDWAHWQHRNGTPLNATTGISAPTKKACNRIRRLTGLRQIMGRLGSRKLVKPFDFRLRQKVLLLNAILLAEWGPGKWGACRKRQSIHRDHWNPQWLTLKRHEWNNRHSPLGNTPVEPINSFRLQRSSGAR